MQKTSKLGVIDGGKKPDVVTVKIIQGTGGPAGFLAFVGGCDLHTYDDTLAAFEEQGYLDLVDNEATKMRLYKCPDTFAIIHIGTKPQQPKNILMPGTH
jgi:hypothetical protein